MTPMKLIVTGSIAFDYLMSYPGKFTEHFLPEHMNRVSLSFLVDSMDKRRGGCAPNIAYTLALLGERPTLMATAGQDFGDYKHWMEAAGIDTSLVKMVDGKFCASFFCSTDDHNNQIASFYTGAMANAAELSFRDVPGLGGGTLVIISPNDPDAMVQYAEECSTMGIRYIWDPGQQCARMAGDQLKDGIIGAFMVVCNDYEFELIRQKTGMSEQDVLAEVPLLVVTKGEHGCTVMTRDGSVDVPAVPPERMMVSPSWTCSAAALPMRRFSSVCSAARFISGGSGISAALRTRRAAPPWARSIMPRRLSWVRSRRTVAALTPKCSLSSATVTMFRCSTSSTICCRLSTPIMYAHAPGSR